MTENWYDALSAAKAGDEPELDAAQGAATQGGTGGVVLTEGAAAPLAQEPSLAALIKLQWVELQRVARENERLMDRLETLLQLHEREQVLRQQLQAQVERLTQSAGAAGQGPDAKAIQHAIREGVAEELKPILIAIVELLELALVRPDSPGQPVEPAPSQATDSGDEHQALPQILTRPLEELLHSAKARGKKAASDTQATADPTDRRGPEACGPKRPGHGRRGGLGPLSWPSVLS